MTPLQLILSGAFLFACGFVWGMRLGHRAGWMACARALGEVQIPCCLGRYCCRYGQPVTNSDKFDEDTKHG